MAHYLTKKGNTQNTHFLTKKGISRLCTPLLLIYRRGMSCLIDKICVVYQRLNTRECPKPYWDFSDKKVLWGVGIRKNPNGLCRNPPHIIIQIKHRRELWLH